MVKYESIFITDPTATDDDLGALLRGFEESVTSGEGKVVKVERWGKRRLGYRIGRHEDGNFTLLFLECPPAAVKELERRYRMNDRVIKYLTVRVKDHRSLMKAAEEGAPAPERGPETAEAE
jgi:small subunit ribosomal protein S6